MCFMIYQHRSEREHHRVILAVYCSARALVKKTQEPGIKLQKASFFRNDTWTSPQTNSEDAPKIPFVHFFLIQDGRHHVTPFSKNRGIP